MKFILMKRKFIRPYSFFIFFFFSVIQYEFCIRTLHKHIHFYSARTNIHCKYGVSAYLNVKNTPNCKKRLLIVLIYFYFFYSKNNLTHNLVKTKEAYLRYFSVCFIYFSDFISIRPGKTRII